MSDFDKEAERERLREKYEEEQQEAQTTERMSELLLKGATMTNAHCGECGDPIFRYEGQEFCPSCQTVVTEADQTGAAQPATDGQQEADETSEQSVEAADTAGETSGQDEPETAAAEDGTVNEEEAEPSDLPERRERASVPDRDRSPSEELKKPDPPAVRRERGDHVEETRSAGGDIAEARDSLERTLLRFAREAERTEDPRRAKEHLEAANEAADALASISEIR